MLILLGIILAHFVLLSKIIFLPYPELFIYPYLTNHGLIPYLQILDQHFPGLMFLPLNFDNLGMQTPTDARIWQFGVVASMHFLIYIVGKKLFKSKSLALTTNFLFLLWQPFFEGWVLWIDSFLAIFYLLTFNFLFDFFERKNVKYLLLSGLTLGVATLFKQVAIPLFVLVSLYLLIRTKNSKNLIYFVLSYLPIPLMMVLYFLLKGVFSDFWYWTVTFNLTIFAQFGRKYINIPELIRVAFVFLPAFLFRPRKSTSTVWLVILFILGASLAAYARFDFIHLQPALPFVLLATVYFVGKLRKQYKVVFLLAYLLGTSLLLRNFYRYYVGKDSLFFEGDTKIIAEKIKNNSNPGEKIFLFGVTPNLYQMTQTLPAGNVFVFQFPWFMMKAGDRVYQGLVMDKPNLVVTDRTVTIQAQKITDYAPEIDNYILNSYSEFDRVGNVQLFKKNEK